MLKKNDVIFDIDPEAVDFIRKRHHGDVTVAMEFEPLLDGG